MTQTEHLEKIVAKCRATPETDAVAKQAGYHVWSATWQDFARNRKS